MSARGVRGATDERNSLESELEIASMNLENRTSLNRCKVNTVYLDLLFKNSLCAMGLFITAGWIETNGIIVSTS